MSSSSAAATATATANGAACRRPARRRPVVSVDVARVAEPVFSTYVAACEGTWRGRRRKMRFSAVTSLLESMDGMREETVEVEEVWRACGGRLEGIRFTPGNGELRDEDGFTLRRETGADGDVLLALEDGSHAAFRPSSSEVANGLCTLDFALALDGGRCRAVAEVGVDWEARKVTVADVGMWHRQPGDEAPDLEPVEDGRGFEDTVEAVRAGGLSKWVVCSPSDGSSWARRTFSAEPVPEGRGEMLEALFPGLEPVVHVRHEGLGQEWPALGVQASPQHNFCSRGSRVDHSVLMVQFTAGGRVIRATLDAEGRTLTSLSACMA